MTFADAEMITGISAGTILKRIRNGSLIAKKNNKGRWDIDARSLYEWACTEWTRGRCLMYRPEQILEAVRGFERRQRPNNAE